jgi:hypothetical protein
MGRRSTEAGMVEWVNYVWERQCKNQRNASDMFEKERRGSEFRVGWQAYLVMTSRK